MIWNSIGILIILNIIDIREVVNIIAQSHTILYSSKLIECKFYDNLKDIYICVCVYVQQ